MRLLRWLKNIFVKKCLHRRKSCHGPDIANAKATETMSTTKITSDEETTTCRCCGDYTYSTLTICDECEDNQSAIDRGEFHDPDLIARDNEERRWSRHW